MNTYHNNTNSPTLTQPQNQRSRGLQVKLHSVQIELTANDLTLATTLGDGDISKGVRRALIEALHYQILNTLRKNTHES